MEVFVLVLFAPLLAGKSAAALAHAYVSNCCVLMSCWLPIVVLACIAYAVLRTWHVLWRFSGTAAVLLYENAPLPPSADLTPDPIFRALNRVRAARGLALVDRFAGRYRVAPDGELAPANTVHILERPFGYWGHDFETKPHRGARALYTIWIGDGRGPRPGYILSTLVLNILLQMALSIAALEAAFANTWLVQGLLVISLLVLGAVSMLYLTPTSDLLLCFQEYTTYALNALAAVYAFAAYHLDAFDETHSLATSDALTLASVWTLVAFAVYDAFGVAFLNRIHSEGFNFRAIGRALCSIPLDAIRLVNAAVTTYTGRSWLRIPPNPHASNATSTMLNTVPSAAPAASAPAGSSSPCHDAASTTEVIEVDVTDLTAELTKLETSESTYRSRAKSYLLAALTALVGGPLCPSAERDLKDKPSHAGKQADSPGRSSSFRNLSFNGRIMRMPNQIGTISVRKMPRQLPPEASLPVSWLEPYDGR